MNARINRYTDTQKTLQSSFSLLMMGQQRQKKYEKKKQHPPIVWCCNCNGYWMCQWRNPPPRTSKSTILKAKVEPLPWPCLLTASSHMSQFTLTLPGFPDQAQIVMITELPFILTPECNHTKCCTTLVGNCKCQQCFFLSESWVSAEALQWWSISAS